MCVADVQIGSAADVGHEWRCASSAGRATTCTHIIITIMFGTVCYAQWVVVNAYMLINQ